MKVLVTGITGLLGGNIARILQLEGHEIKGLIRKTSSLKALHGVEFEKCYGGLQDSKELEKAMTGCDAVIHAAADTHHYTTSYLPSYQVNLDGTINVMNAVKHHQINRLVYISTVNVFGNGTSERPGDEGSPFAYQKNNSCYIQSKYQSHLRMKQEVEENGLPAIMLCPTFMLGAHDSKPSSGQIILYALKNRINFAPPGGKNFVHVRDVAVAAVNALSRGKIGESYILGNENLSYRAFFDLVQEVSGYPIYQVDVPKWALMGAGEIGEYFQKMFGRNSQLTISNTSLLCTMHYYSSAKAQIDLDFPQTPVKTAIKDAIDWFVEHKYI
jgi:dihydroflavonol-4-reductase